MPTQIEELIKQKLAAAFKLGEMLSNTSSHTVALQAEMARTLMYDGLKKVAALAFEKDAAKAAALYAEMARESDRKILEFARRFAGILAEVQFEIGKLVNEHFATAGREMTAPLQEMMAKVPGAAESTAASTAMKEAWDAVQQACEQSAKASISAFNTWSGIAAKK
jgi:phasin family protein